MPVSFAVLTFKRSRAITRPNLSRDHFDAALFDLDGVLTATASVHAEAWKSMFDQFLQSHATRQGTPFQPFEIATDYLQHVDGKPRLAGVRDFLASRGITLPEGTPEDHPDQETISGLGNRKNQMVLEAIRQGRVQVYDSSRRLVDHLRSLGMKTAVVSSSRNAVAVLAAAQLDHLFDTVVDGNSAAQLQLPGKPDPATFLEAARQLEVPPSRAIVVEDATAGCEAARAGGFALVIGVDRGGHAAALKQAGADLVVEDLAAFDDQSS